MWGKNKCEKCVYFYFQLFVFVSVSWGDCWGVFSGEGGCNINIGRLLVSIRSERSEMCNSCCFSTSTRGQTNSSRGTNDRASIMVVAGIPFLNKAASIFCSCHHPSPSPSNNNSII